jgi:hypothetical protein
MLDDLQVQVASAGKTGQGLSEEVLSMSSQLQMQQSELESSKQVLQGRQASLDFWWVELEYLSAEHNISCLVGYQNLSPHT